MHLNRNLFLNTFIYIGFLAHFYRYSHGYTKIFGSFGYISVVY